MGDYTLQQHATGIPPVPRTRSLASGVVLIVLGLWAGLIPFVGPYFGYAYTPAAVPWMFTWGRLWLQILPAAAAIAGGVVLLSSANRPTLQLGGWLALASGAWLLIGPPLSRLWVGAGPGTPSGNAVSRAVEEIGFFTGLGGVIIAAAALALGRVSVRDAHERRFEEQHRAATEATLGGPQVAEGGEGSPRDSESATSGDGKGVRTYAGRLHRPARSKQDQTAGHAQDQARDQE